jgi:hypothetical protein
MNRLHFYFKVSKETTYLSYREQGSTRDICAPLPEDVPGVE